MIKRIIEEIEKHITESIPEITKYGEVFTKIETINEMLDILPDNFWENPNIKILDPCNGIGNFPSVIIKKLMKGLKNFEPDIEKRYGYIIENIIYVCEIQPRNISHYLKLFNIDGKYDMNYYEGSYLDDKFNISELWKINKFDLVLGNPPYQIGNDSRSSTSIYHKFVEKSIKISNMVLMITPSKWYTNPSMFSFRENMINNYGLKILVDMKNDIFENVEIKGGVSYFLLENEFIGKCLYNNSYKTFNNNLITDGEYDYILDKIKTFDMFSEILKSDQYFGIRNKDDRFLSKKEDNCVTCYVSSRNGNIKYVKENNIEIKTNHLKYKVFLPTASGSKENIGELGRVVIGKPTDISSRSFIHFAFESMEECQSFVSYINTDIIKKLISLKKQTQLVKKDCFSFVPIVPLDRVWDNDSVKEYFKL